MNKNVMSRRDPEKYVVNGMLSTVFTHPCKETQRALQDEAVRTSTL